MCSPRRGQPKRKSADRRMRCVVPAGGNHNCPQGQQFPEGRLILNLPQGVKAKEGIAHIAQSAERILGKDEVIGSSPIMGSIQGGVAQLARAYGSYP